MLRIFEYDRSAAFSYAKKWAFMRNPAYYDFSAIGGDCTNYASQCIFAGSGIMNFTPIFGWYYNNISDRTASWSGVEFLYNFLTGNRGVGPFATIVSQHEAQVGDIVQLAAASGDFYHSPIISGFSSGQPLVAAHTFDAFDRPLNSYSFERVRFLHIEGVRAL